MIVKASLKDAALSAQKARLIADMIRKMPVLSALNVLKFSPKKGSAIMFKLLNSAIANAENNVGADIEELNISTVYVDEASTLKRTSPRAKGRANRISKRRCHITINVSDEV